MPRRPVEAWHFYGFQDRLSNSSQLHLCGDGCITGQTAFQSEKVKQLV